MKKFLCRVCGAALYFENSLCIHCGTALGYSRQEHAIVPVNSDGAYFDECGTAWYRCANLHLSGCTWLAPVKGDECFSCSLTRTRPNDHDAKGLAQFLEAERAKRHLIAELDALNLPIVTRAEDPHHGLAFDLLSSVNDNVVIGHNNGVITIDVAETEDAHREEVRAKLGEPYRTMLGHFRHEVGHYFEGALVFSDAELTRQAREIFGDATRDYQKEIARHYAEGAPDGWESEYISKYATMHPYEDFAETFAHYLHISDTIDTAYEFGLATPAPQEPTTFREVVEDVWLPLSTALNQINRSMGHDDLYPFIIPNAVINKLAFVSSLRTSG